MIRFYFDEHMPRAAADGLSKHGLEVVMAVDVGMVEKDDDAEHLVYATQRDMVMVTFDRPFAGRTMSRTDHKGLVCLSESVRSDIGAIIRLLASFSEKITPEQASGQVFWLK